MWIEFIHNNLPTQGGASVRKGSGVDGDAGFAVTRRGFLGGVAATQIVAATSGFAFAQDFDDVDADADLIFLLSDNQRSLIVRRLPPLDDEGKRPNKSYKDWLIEAAAFGPNAWFDLDRQDFLDWSSAKQTQVSADGLTHRRLTVRDASWGRYVLDGNHKQLYVKLHFERGSKGPWKVAFNTNVWPTTSQPVLLHELIGDIAKPLVAAKVSATTLNGALKAMFDEQLAVVGAMSISLDAGLQWSLRPVGTGRSISAFDGCVAAPVIALPQPGTPDKIGIDAKQCKKPESEGSNPKQPESDTPEPTEMAGVLTVAWIQPTGAEGSSQRRRLIARCPAVWTKPLSVASTTDAPQVTVGPREGAKVETNPPKLEKQHVSISGDLYVGQLDPQSAVVLEGGADKGTIVALFSAPTATFECVWPSGEGRLRVEEPLCKTLELDDVSVTRIASREVEKKGNKEVAKLVWRDVVVADAGGSRKPPPPEVKIKKTSSEANKPGESPQALIETKNGKTDAAPVPKNAAEAAKLIMTPIGTMLVGPLPVDMALPVEKEPEGETAEQRKARKAAEKFDAVSAAAIGDRGGISNQTFYLVVDRKGGPSATKNVALQRKTDAVRRLYADVALYGLGIALPDTSDSELKIAGSHFRFVFGDGLKLQSLVLPEVAWSTPDGHLWLGNPNTAGELAALDLGRTKLHARRDRDLVDLKFQFADFILAFTRIEPIEHERVELRVPGWIERTLRPARLDARQIIISRLREGLENDEVPHDPRDDHVIDSRPILAVEFPPQHVMEEAFFRQTPGPLPDMPWPKEADGIEKLIQKLKDEPDVAERAELRRVVAERKVSAEAEELKARNPQPPAAGPTDQAAPPVAPPEVGLFTQLRRHLKEQTSLEADQQQYIGPYEMSADAILIAREWQSKKLQEILGTAINRMLEEAAKVVPQNMNAGPLETKPGSTETGSNSLEYLLTAEAEAERIYPLYKLWRDSFRDYMIKSAKVEYDPSKAEFVNRLRAPTPPKVLLPPDGVEGTFKPVFIDEILGNQPYDRLAMARLSGRTLLSFRMNIEAGPGDSYEINGLPWNPENGPGSPGTGVQRFGAIPFTFEELTNWSRHEPHVHLRARKLYEPLKSGSIPPVIGRVASVDDHAILAQQGFERGVKTSEVHLGRVRGSLSKRPGGLETQIELPARLILSTAQNAIWQSPRRIRRRKPLGEPDIFDTDPGKSSEGSSGVTTELHQPLWTARLITEDAEPGLRAIWSPDVRPEAIGYFTPGGAGVPRRGGPPPRGPWAPWVLRREQIDGVRVDPKGVKQAEDYVETGTRLPDPPTGTDPSKPVAADGSVCMPDGKVPGFLQPVTTIGQRPPPTMFQRICEIFWLRALYNKDPELHSFRSSLDAYDRHELVLLSSAYGLPVTGKRQQIGTSDTDAAGLNEKSGQFEPGDDFHLTDAHPDLAFYRPKPLDVSELALSAVGGFLNHDTNFQPPAPGINFEGTSMFDGLSIERWQHLIVLGRDILATVVYSGYLFPLGHKASLVKITERVFVKMNKSWLDQARKEVRDGKGSFEIKAILRQRMFVRVATPSKKYPAVGQPNKGRQWCSENVTMLTRETPDIVDPTLEFDTQPTKTSPSGRIHLSNRPGLAFWPQIAMTPEARFQFEFQLEGRRTKMPLIFVDRIAAKDKDALKVLLDYYHDGVSEDARTCRMGGQDLRYAESVKDGDTTFKTESIVVSVEGRASTDLSSWPGKNDRTNNTGVLEGADQPPFYPVMHHANIRIAQAETMAGSAMGPVRVRFDGGYVLGGFRARTDGSASASEQADQSEATKAAENNRAEAFLYVDSLTPPKMSMGPNGNQSGGVGRPNMDIVGLSRSKGILGSQPGKRIYEHKPPSPSISDYEALKSDGPVVSLARYFSLKPADLAPPGSTAPPSASVQATTPEDTATTTVFESFFSADAKLLGVISFQNLMKLLTLVGGVNAIPALQEAVEYGSQALRGLEKGAADAISLIQGELLSPLLVLVRQARTEWSKIENTQTEAQKEAYAALQKISPNSRSTSLGKLYPEIDKGLADLEAALTLAMAETDPVAMIGRLGVVYESGRRFMRELARLAANPVERIEQAARAQIDTIGGDLQVQIDRYQDLATNLVAALQNNFKNKMDAIKTELIGYLIDRLPWEEIAAIQRTAKTGSDLKELAEDLLKQLSDIDLEFSDIAEELRDGKVGPASALNKVAHRVIAGAKTAAGTKADDLLATSVLDVPNDLLIPGDESGRVLGKQLLLKALVEYRGRLEEADKSIDSLTPTAKMAEWFARIQIIQRLAIVVQDLLQTKDPKRVLSLLGKLGSEFLGFDIAELTGKLQDEVRKELTAWVNEVAKSLAALAASTVTTGQIDPLLSEFAIAACIAKLPVGPGPEISDTAKFKELNDTAAEAASTIADQLASSLHFLADFAKSVDETFGVRNLIGIRAPALTAQLTRASGDLRQLTLPPNVAAFPDAVDALVTAIPLYRTLFCDVTAIVGRAQSAHGVLTVALQAVGTNGMMENDEARHALGRLKLLAGEIGQGLRRVREVLSTLIDTLEPHAGVYATAAALDALVDTPTTDWSSIRDEIIKWDRVIATDLRRALQTVFRAAGVVATAASTDAKAVFAFVRPVVEGIPTALNPERANFAAALSKLESVTAALLQSVPQLQLDPPADADPTLKELLDAKIGGVAGPTVALAFKGSSSIANTEPIENAIDDLSKAYDGLVARIKGLPEVVGARIRDGAETAATKLLDSSAHKLLVVLNDAYRVLIDKRNTILSGDLGLAAPVVRRALLVEPLGIACNPLEPTCDKLFEEHKAIKALVDPYAPGAEPRPITERRNQLQAYWASVSGGRFAVEQMADNVGEIYDDIARGNLAALVDIAAMRDQVEDLISQLIPVKQTRKYDLDFAFDANKVAKLTGGVFVPKPPSRFVLSMVATIDLLKAKADMKAVGSIGPFNVKLIGNIFDAVELIFDGVDFGFELGSSPRFDVHYNDFKIGQKLKFVEKLQAYMSPSDDGTGFFIEPMRGRPGIVAGYGINLGTLQLGGIAFSNILLNAAAELPFDGDAAIFRFALGRTLAPFLISVPPYGGGGYVAIFADAQGFRGVEASLEFGGVADFSTGPLVAKGRITAGFFIRSMKMDMPGGGKRTVTDIYGTFFAGGEASIWIFSFYASLYVRLGMKDGGKMEGVATFTFSFSMGICDYDYSVTLRHERQAIGGGGGGQSGGGDDGAMLNAPFGVDASIMTASTLEQKITPNVVADVKPFGETTIDEFLAYFDLDLVAGGLAP